jgi:hypothetical protein
VPDDASNLEAVMRYHERTKHHLNRFAPGPGQLDWANQPDPFRRYAGAPLVDSRGDTMRIAFTAFGGRRMTDAADDILASLDEADPAIDRLWAKEAEERLAAYRRGEIKALPLEEVLAKYRVK